MRLLGRFIIATSIGLVLAAGVHIAVILASPHFARQDAFARIAALPPAETAQIISAPGGAPTWLPKPDPAAVVAVCPFDLDLGPTRVAARTGPLLMMVSFHAKTGDLFFAVTDKAAARGQLELVVMTPRQLDEARADDDENAPSRDVRIVAPGNRGYVVVRVVAPMASLRAQAEEAAKAVSCTVDQDEDEE
ncbi:DUF1254 domain-containing protein [Microvirga terricola]|uniref:DUF1254 domain-containing protein n=1 Tax=Microvirga terricola TaxID=2719797 RepID=A0ABX0VDY3_9HYPH|nr:hypothetical protein [Microvirga terricola]NIX76875.1 hypothetical protein [Microvirga terricola]